MNSIVVFLSFVAVAFAGQTGESSNQPAAGGQVPSNIEDLKSAFDIMKDEEGFITAETLAAVIKRLGLNDEPMKAAEKKRFQGLKTVLKKLGWKEKDVKNAQKWINAVDLDDDGKINLHEFVTMMTADDRGKSYRETFKYIAGSEKGISANGVFEALGKTGGPGLSNDEIGTVSTEWTDGTLDHDAFTKFLHRTKQPSRHPSRQPSRQSSSKASTSKGT